MAHQTISSSMRASRGRAETASESRHPPLLQIARRIRWQINGGLPAAGAVVSPPNATASADPRRSSPHSPQPFMRSGALRPRATGTHGEEAAMLEELTRRELEVLKLVARGHSNAELAEALHVTEATVKTHVAHILRKLKLRDRVQAVVFAYESGLIVARVQSHRRLGGRGDERKPR